MGLISTRKHVILIGFSVVLLSASGVFAQTDTQPPQLVNVAISPSEVDVTASTKTVTFTLHHG
jgi:hypothetical protein